MNIGSEVAQQSGSAITRARVPSDGLGELLVKKLQSEGTDSALSMIQINTDLGDKACLINMDGQSVDLPLTHRYQRA